MKTKRRPIPVATRANPELAQAMQLLRRSSATTPKPVRAQRKQRSRRGQLRAAIRDAS